MKVIEKERKWLLKRIPDYVYNNVETQYYIEQFYSKDGWRYRCQSVVGENKYTYHRLKKQSIGHGINVEMDIEIVTEQQYNDAMIGENPLRVVRKDRYVLPYNGKVLEIDWFHDLSLVVMEIEDVEFDETIVLPDGIESYVLMEVTGNSKFSNYNLAIEEEN